MGKINLQRVLIGGLLAGVVINAGEMLFHAVVFKDTMQTAMAALGKTVPEDASRMAYWITFGFLYGIALVWVYAAIRPRFGASVKTAVYAGLVVWLFGGLFNVLGEAPLGLFPRNFYVMGAVWGLIEIPIAAVAGAWLYKEPAAQPAHAMA
jgi:hypothetical protein